MNVCRKLILCDEKIVEELLEAFGMKRSLSQKGCPYDNAVAEATPAEYRKNNLKKVV